MQYARQEVLLCYMICYYPMQCVATFLYPVSVEDIELSRNASYAHQMFYLDVEDKTTKLNESSGWIWYCTVDES